MAEITVRCPDCGREIQIEEEKEFCFCEECGRKILLDAVRAAEAEPAEPEAAVEAAPAVPEEAPEAEAEPAPAPETEPAAVPEEVPDAEPEADTEPAAVPEEVPEEAPEAEAEPAAETKEPVPAAEPKPAFFESAAPIPAPVPGKPQPAAEEKPVPVPKPTGFGAELDRLFREQRYEEAYDGYVRYLQSHPGDIRSMYRQGIAAVYLSEGNIFRTAELRSSVGAACNAMTKTGDRSLAPEKDQELIELLLFMTEHAVSFNDKLASQEDCASQVNGWIALSGLYMEAAPLITSETRREEALRAGVEFCDRALAFKTSYFTGTTKVSNGKTKEEYAAYALEKKPRQTLREARRRMAGSYNTLGSRTAEETRLNEDAAAAEKDISRLRTDIRRTKEKYKTSRKLFLLEKPEVRSARGKILRNSAVIGAVVLAVLGVFAFFVFRKEKTFLFILLLLLAAAFAYAAFVITRKSLIKFEADQYPEGLKALYDRLEENKKQLKETRKHASRAKDALSRFNRSKL